MSTPVLIQTIRISLYALVASLLMTASVLEKNFISWNLIFAFYVFSAIGAFLNVLPLFSIEKFYRLKTILFISFIVDIVITSALVIYSGLNQAIFLFLYMAIIILSGIVFRTRGALVLAAAVSCLYTIASWFNPEIKALSFMFMLVLNNSFFFIVAGISGYLGEQLRIFAEKLELQTFSLKVMQKLNEMIVNSIPLGLLSLNENSQVVQFNPGAEKIFGTELDLGITLPEKWPQLKTIGRLSDLKDHEKMELEFSIKTDQKDRFVRLQILPHSNEFSERVFLVVIEDLTEKQQMEFSLRQSEKMAAVGQLAAGIAHEIRNPLAGISGSIQLLSQNFQSEDDKKLSQIIMREIDRLNRLISEFLDFAKPEKPPTDLINLKSLLEETGRALVAQSGQMKLKNEFQLKFQFCENNEIFGHADKLKQCFLNIGINSLQAMEQQENPEIVISTEVIDEKNLRVKIKDNGCGMKPETLQRMFEAFHTTKPKGTGLGLAITHKILEAHRAQVFVESEIGLGTEFLISFPLGNKRS